MELLIVEKDGDIGFNTRFHGLRPEVFMQGIIYALDTGMHGDKALVDGLIGMLPGVSDKYFELKNSAEDVELAKEDLGDVLKESSLTTLNAALANELTKEDCDMEYAQAISIEIMRRSNDTRASE